MEFIIPQYINSSTCFERYVAHHHEPQLYLQLLVYVSLWRPSVVLSLLWHYGRSPQAYVNQKLQIQLRFLMMSDITLETS